MISTIGAINSVQRLDPDTMALLNRATALGYAHPSAANINAINQFFISAKAAAGGSLSAFVDIRVYMTDLAAGGLNGFDSIHWNNPNATLVQSFGTVTKTSKKGYSQTANAGYLISNTIIDSSIAANRNDLSVMWVWLDAQNVGIVGSGIAIGTTARAIASYPKYTATNAVMGLGGREYDFASPNGDQFLVGELNGSTARVFINNSQIATNSILGYTDFNSNMLDLAINLSPTTTINAGSTRVPAPVKIGAVLMWRTGSVDRTQLYNAISTYKTTVFSLP